MTEGRRKDRQADVESSEQKWGRRCLVDYRTIDQGRDQIDLLAGLLVELSSICSPLLASSNRGNTFIIRSILTERSMDFQFPHVFVANRCRRRKPTLVYPLSAGNNEHNISARQKQPTGLDHHRTKRQRKEGFGRMLRGGQRNNSRR